MDRRQIWFRAAIISLLSIALAIVAGLVTPYLRYTLDADIGQRSDGTILQIMASSMLAVTTFSLTSMVSPYCSATQFATQRTLLQVKGEANNAVRIALIEIFTIERHRTFD